MRFLPASDTALLVELDDLAQTTALYRTLMERPINGVQDMVPAARTILVYYRQAVLPLQALITALRDLPPRSLPLQSRLAPRRQ